MALYLKRIGNSYNLPIKFFECETETDLQGIDTTYIVPCSEAFVIENNTTYILNTNKQWKIKSSGSEEEKTYVYDGGSIMDPSGEYVIYDGGQI